ncbi:ABC transporter ATP-binding protein [Granulicella mallensis]|uniref:ABC-2 type transport system ATP-binding protein n=1 Tax=Granulicella mallensis TaxID=940614 RepID=A0A7W7ZSQ3_9BACT|nr:ABC transporter ATP-binding protein [Granulicella mallensis]MBB5065406.1 ABC-2 type transport system ATP-binding protein [Granulicella mallensis]
MNVMAASPETRQATNSQDTVASLGNITKRYSNGVVALDGLSLSLRRGEIVALLGPNGAGKSTAVKLMMGLSTPTAGDVRIFGADPRNAAARIRTGVMLQVGRAPEMLRVREHLAIFRGYYPNPMPYAEIVKAAGLEGIEARMFGQLSGGQKQRVLFSMALAGDPDLIFLDEPTVGLDIEARRGMWAQIRELAARGKTVLLTTHYLEEADALAHRIVVINKGRVVCEGTPAEVKSMGAGLSSPNDTSPGVNGVKIIRCVTTLTSEHLLAMPGVSAVEPHGTLTLITSTQPESTLREMLALDLQLHSLEVQSPALEDAFLALTADPS